MPYSRQSIFAYALLLLTGITAIQAHAWKTAGGFSSDWESLSISVEQLSPSLYFMHGSGGNMLLSAGADGNLLVDNEFLPISDKILDVIASIQEGPVRFVLNTHWHGDHTAMNDMLANNGATVIAHDNTRQRMMSDQFNLFFKSQSAPRSASALPLISFEDQISLHVNGESVRFFFINPAHSDSDAIVWFPKSNVIHMGDIFISDLYPIIDVVGGGDVNGYAVAIDAALELIDDNTKVIPGHGPVSNKATLLVYRNMIETIKIRVQDMLDKGFNIDQILATNPSKEFDLDWASDRVGPDDVTMMVYQSLSGDFPKVP